VTDEGKGSGGSYASGDYRRDDRRLELHFRWSLGLVTYHVGAWSLEHVDYVRAVQAVTGTDEAAAYPGFSVDASVGFEHLAIDLERFGGVFLNGSDAQFEELHRWAGKHPRPRGLAALP
jgi:hypothetical protein